MIVNPIVIAKANDLEKKVSPLQTIRQMGGGSFAL
jgi:hypothetical protein